MTLEDMKCPCWKHRMANFFLEAGARAVARRLTGEVTTPEEVIPIVKGFPWYTKLYIATCL